MISYLEFEKPVAALEARIAELRQTAKDGAVDISAEVRRLEMKSADLLASTYAALTPWQKTQVARHPMRPHFGDMQRRCSRISCRWAVIVVTVRTRRSLAALPNWMAAG